MNRVETGVPGLDNLLKGGFPACSSILLIGPPGVGKTTLAQQFLSTGLYKDQPAIYITLDISPEEAKSAVLKFNQIKDEDNLRLVDAYSWRTGGSEQKYSVSNLGNINELNIAVSEAMEGLDDKATKRNILDSVSTLLLYADPNLVLRLLPVIIAKAKKAGYVYLMVIEEGVHDAQTVARLNSLTDGLLEFKLEGDKRLMRISKMAATDHDRAWHEFDITDKGLIFKEEATS